MNYKKWIRSRKLRLFLLKLLSVIPDKWMIKIQYRIKFNRKLDLNHPQRFTEKLQWYKLNGRTPLMRQCVDKYEVRKYIKECGFPEILIPIVGVFDRPKDIPYEELPGQFVLKDTLGGGGNSVMICKDKDTFDWKGAMSQMNKWVKAGNPYKSGGREWVYGGKKHRIIIESYLNVDENSCPGGLIDYKFFCFQGKVEYIYVIADRIVGGKVGLGIFDAEYRKLNAVRSDEKPLEREIEKPQNYDEMIFISEKVAKPFLEARIDLYNIQNKVYFGEITFFDGSGYMSFDPDEFDFVMGEKFILPERYRG